VGVEARHFLRGDSDRLLRLFERGALRRKEVRQPDLYHTLKQSVLERLKRSEHAAGLAGSSGRFRALQIDAAASYPVWTAIGPWQWVACPREADPNVR
jgi:hypothetical protein